MCKRMISLAILIITITALLSGCSAGEQTTVPGFLSGREAAVNQYLQASDRFTVTSNKLKVGEETLVKGDTVTWVPENPDERTFRYVFDNIFRMNEEPTRNIQVQTANGTIAKIDALKFYNCIESENTKKPFFFTDLINGVWSISGVLYGTNMLGMPFWLFLIVLLAVILACLFGITKASDPEGETRLNLALLTPSAIFALLFWAIPTILAMVGIDSQVGPVVPVTRQFSGFNILPIGLTNVTGWLVYIGTVLGLISFGVIVGATIRKHKVKSAFLIPIILILNIAAYQFLSTFLVFAIVGLVIFGFFALIFGGIFSIFKNVRFVFWWY